MKATILLAAVCALLSARTALAVSADELSFAQINAANATRQWTLQLATGNKARGPDGGFVPVNCSSNLFGACTSTNPAMTQTTGDLLRLTYTLRTPRGPGGSLATYQGQTPTRLLGKLCYSAYVSVDRAWRSKNKAYPRLSQNCPINIGETAFVGGINPVDTAANSGSFVLDMDTQDEIPDATWFAMLWVYCGDTVCADETTENVNFVETKVEMGITPGMRAAAIILSVFSPAFFIAYYIADSIYYKKTGKGLRFNI